MESSVAAVKGKYPELRSYPCSEEQCNTLGNLPRYIEYEEKDGYSYLAFIQTGSGLPIVHARCFSVSPGGEIAETGNYSPASGVIKNRISPANCT